jgi:hypothetical protein
MRQKTKINSTITINSKDITPGPGKYENPEALSPKGVYLVTKHRGTGATKFNPPSSKRFIKDSINIYK